MRKCLILLSIAVMKHDDQRQLGEENIYFSLQLSGHTNWKRVRSWRKDAYWLASYGLLSLLSLTTQDRLHRYGTAQNGFRPLTAIIKQENSCTHLYTGQSFHLYINLLLCLFFVFITQPKFPLLFLSPSLFSSPSHSSSCLSGGPPMVISQSWYVKLLWD